MKYVFGKMEVIMVSASKSNPSTDQVQARWFSRVRRLPIVAAAPFLLPALVLYLVFAIFPVYSSIRLSFYEWDGISSVQTFVGLENYVTIFTEDEIFWIALRNTALWTSLSLFIPTSMGLALAVALNQKIKGRNAFRTAFFVPGVIASIAVAGIWSWMYNPNLGIVNTVLREIGAEWLIQDWLGDYRIALLSVFAASVWQSAGSNMILFLAGLQTVPQDLIEAAKVDGASAMQRFFSVVLPSIRPTFVVVISLTIINSLKAFELIYGMTGGGPAQSTNVLASWSYFQALQLRNFGVGMAVAVVLLLITLVIVIPYVLWASRTEET
jgi:raffinose/stachyose/melibiose transport system permease protein